MVCLIHALDVYGSSGRPVAAGLTVIATLSDDDRVPSLPVSLST
jgi:hypothetical protein